MTTKNHLPVFASRCAPVSSVSRLHLAIRLCCQMITSPGTVPSSLVTRHSILDTGSSSRVTSHTSRVTSYELRLLQWNLRVLYHLRPFRDLGAYELIELLAAHRRRFPQQLVQAELELRRAQDRVDVRVQLFEQWRRYCSRPAHAIPRRYFIAGESRFLHRGHLPHLRGAICARDRERPQPSSLN